MSISVDFKPYDVSHNSYLDPGSPFAAFVSAMPGLTKMPPRRVRRIGAGDRNAIKSLRHGTSRIPYRGSPSSLTGWGHKMTSSMECA
jgi:hypothetical protein